ncbi:MAG TPA: hypothetical protein VMH87_03360 [Pseudomonadales bacterium]|nr:hypothetical protein [Pseudomonadales bacterium]
MKKIILPAIFLLALLAAPLARAWSYNDGDLLLIFRETGFNDIEYNLGSVSNLLGHANGYTTTITGWNPSPVTSQFGSDLTGVSVILVAVTSATNATPTAWLSSPDPNTTAYNVGAWSQNLHSIISAVANRPITSPYSYTLKPVAVTPTNAFSISVSSGASYDSIVSGGTFANIPNLGGHSPFTVEQVIPGSFDFWAVQPTSVYPNPPPDQLVGTFTITAGGVLTFVSGPRQSTITGVNHSSNVSSVQFTTTVGNHYSVAYTNQLGGNTAWPVDAATIIGDGNIDTINHTNNNGGVEFYRVNTQ